MDKKEDTEEIIHNLEIGEEYIFIYPKVDDIPADKIVIKRVK